MGIITGTRMERGMGEERSGIKHIMIKEENKMWKRARHLHGQPSSASRET